jgi:signal transduction histidine kinase
VTSRRAPIRAKLTAWYGGGFLLIGITLLAINYLLVSNSLPAAESFAVATEDLPALKSVAAVPSEAAPARPAGDSMVLVRSLGEYRSSALRTLLAQSATALVITIGLATLLGWLVAGRVLRPVHQITATARRLGAENLDRRIRLAGPRDELTELADTFDDMLDRLAGAFDSQRRFVANASHELRTPLALQRALIEVAMDDPVAGADLHTLGQHLLQTNERSEQLIQGLLLLARSDRGLTSREPVRLDKVVGTVLATSTQLAAQHQVTLTTQTVPQTVAGDPVLLEHLVTNLVHNAIRYNTPGGTVHTAVTTGPALQIRNTGQPIPAEAIPTLFEPFRRLNADRLTNTSGAGLGLPLVRSIATAHGGTAHAEPGEHGGLTVTVDLPPTGGTLSALEKGTNGDAATRSSVNSAD